MSRTGEQAAPRPRGNPRLRVTNCHWQALARRLTLAKRKVVSRQRVMLSLRALVSRYVQARPYGSAFRDQPAVKRAINLQSTCA